MKRLGKPVRALLAAAIGLGVAVAGLELGLRFLLFSDSGVARRLGGDWRKAEWYADAHAEDAYWKLQHLFLPPSARSPVPGPDPVCGWIGDFRPGTHDPPAIPDLRGRRLVLLYGDSFAHCVTTPSHCFPALLEQSDLGARFAMVDLGVGGYGLDQILLLLRATIDRWKELDPIVVVSFLVDDDFHRSTLTFRGWPKPRFSIEDGKLVPSGPTILPPEEFLAAHPVGIRSYLARLLVFRGGFLPDALRSRLRRAFDRREEQIALGRRILEEIHAELAGRGLAHVFLAFHGWDSLQPAPVTAWADELVVDTAARLGVPLIGTRPYLLAAVGGNAALAGPRLFDSRNGRFGHYNDLGNWVAFAAIRRAIEGGGEGGTEGGVDPGAHARVDDVLESADTTFLGSPARVQRAGNDALARSSSVPYPPFDAASTSEYLLLRPGDHGPTRVRIAVPAGATRLRAKAIAVARDGAPSRLALSVALDDRKVLDVEPPLFPDGVDVDVELGDAREVELAASRTGVSSAWIHLADARFTWKP